MIVILSYRRWRKIKKRLRRIEELLYSIEASVNEYGPDDCKPRQDEDEEDVDYEIRLSKWQAKKRSENER